MSTGDILGTGVSGLLAFQRALGTTGHNIANVNTDGYSRQRVDLATRTPQFAADGFIGKGVDVATVSRVYNDFLTSQLRTSTTTFEQLDRFHELTSRIDNLLADDQAGLAPALGNFFSAVHGVADDPASIPARSVMLSEADALVNRFRYLDGRLSDLRSGINTDLQDIVTEINGLASAIARTNHDIVVATGLSLGQPPNDLLDKRDQLIAQLAEHVAVTTVAQDDGALNVFIGNGQSLVVASQARSLQTTRSTYDPARLEVAFAPPDGSAIISNSLSGGRIGGLLDFRNQVLDPAQNALGRVAIGLAQTFNDQHALGTDLRGSLGGDFFTLPAARVLGSRNNTSDALVTVGIDDASRLTTADYRLQFDGVNGWTLTNLTTRLPVTLVGAGTDANPFIGDGLSISVEDVAATPGQGYSFLIQPTRDGAADIALALSDGARIAAAAPVRTSASSANSGSGRISAGVVTDVDSLPLASNGGPITLTFDASVVAATAATQATNQITFAGTQGTQTIDFSGLTLANVDDGDYLVIGGNRFVVDSTGALADNFTTRVFYVDTSAVATLDDLAQAFAGEIDAVDASVSNTATRNSLEPTARVGAVLTLTSAYATSTSTHLAVTGNAFDSGGVGETAATTLAAGTGTAAGSIVTFNQEDFVFNFLGSGVLAGGAQTEVTFGASAAATAANFAAAIDPQAGIAAAAVGNVVTITADTAGAAGTALVTDTDPAADTGITKVVTAGTDAGGQLPGFVVTGGPGGTLYYNPATDSGGKTFTLGAPFGGLSFTVSGDPADGDIFVIADNTNGVGDNRNARILADMQFTATLGATAGSGPSASYGEAYSRLVTDVGSRARTAQVNRDAQASLRDQAVAARDSVAGVNLDEEAANMLRFQQAYQAAAQVIATANLMFDELIGVLRR